MIRFNSRPDPFFPEGSATQESMKIKKAKNQPKGIENVQNFHISPLII